MFSFGICRARSLIFRVGSLTLARTFIPNRQQERAMSWIAFSVFWILLCAKGVWCLSITEFHIPDNVRVGDTITLTCQYDLEGDELFSVKWYRGRNNFYRFIPLDRPQKMFFPLIGIDVDLEQSDDTMLTLKEVDKTTSGEFMCEVSMDAPSFSTAAASDYLSVEDIDDSSSST